jgi:spore coat protein U-like protein
MSNGVNTLSYNLYADAAYSEIWGDGSGGTVSVSGNASSRFTVYGMIPDQAPPAPGVYTDNLVITISY